MTTLPTHEPESGAGGELSELSQRGLRFGRNLDRLSDLG